MKLLLSVILCFLCLQLNGQEKDEDIKTKITFFNSKINQTEKGERLQWLDSLNRIVLDKTEFKYDSIARVVIDYAIALDSLSYATAQVCDLIYHYNYVVNKPKKGILLFDSYYKKIEKSKDSSAIGNLYLKTGESYEIADSIDKAMDYYKEAIAYSKPPQYKRLEALGSMYLGFLQQDKGLFSASSVSLNTAYQIFEGQRDTSHMIGAKNGLSILYSMNAFYDEAKKERDEAIELVKKSNSSFGLTSLYYNAAIDAKKTANPKQQIAYLKTALNQESYVSKTMAAYVQNTLLISLSKAYAENDSLELAEASFKKFQLLNKDTKNEQYNRQRVDGEKTISFAKGNFSDAVKYGEMFLAFEKKKSNYEALMIAEKFLSKAYGAAGNSVERDTHLVNYYKIKDSISSVQNVRSLSYYQTLYETEKQRLKIERQEKNIVILDTENRLKTQWIIFGGLGILAVFLLITLQRSKSTGKREKKQQEKFSQDLMQSQEDERTRIARELHDSVGQKLTLIKKKSQNLDQFEITTLTNNALEEVRSISKGLYPTLLKELGLTDSIQQLVDEYDKQTNLFFTMDLEDVDSYFTENTTLNFYRLIQECLTNIVKHAKAKAVTVSIKKEEKTIITCISDNGKGFDVGTGKKKNSLGLKTIFERIRIMNGKLSIDSKMKVGTTFIFTIPIKNES